MRRLRGDATFAVSEAVIPTPSFICRGPTVFTGYRGDVGATAAAFAPGGWFRTGDMARLGARCYLSIVDRRVDMVRRTCQFWVSRAAFAHVPSVVHHSAPIRSRKARIQSDLEHVHHAGKQGFASASES